MTTQTATPIPQRLAYDYQEAAELLGISFGLVRKPVENGQLPPTRRPVPDAPRPKPRGHHVNRDYPHIPKSFDTITPISADLVHWTGCSFVRRTC